MLVLVVLLVGSLWWCRCRCWWRRVGGIGVDVGVGVVGVLVMLMLLVVVDFG